MGCIYSGKPKLLSLSGQVNTIIRRPKELILVDFFIFFSRWMLKEPMLLDKQSLNNKFPKNEYLKSISKNYSFSYKLKQKTTAKNLPGCEVKTM